MHTCGLARSLAAHSRYQHLTWQRLLPADSNASAKMVGQLQYWQLHHCNSGSNAFETLPHNGMAAWLPADGECPEMTKLMDSHLAGQYKPQEQCRPANTVATMGRQAAGRPTFCRQAAMKLRKGWLKWSGR